MRDTKTYPPDISRRQQRFEAQCRAALVKAQTHEDGVLQTQALEAIPVADIGDRALTRLNGLSSEARKAAPDISSLERHCVLLELMSWFKNEFFSWANSFPCTRCPTGSNRTEFDGMTEPSAQERLDGAGRVERYKCANCAQYVRFPRYDHPRKLLETRVGRCGEWANCFTLCVRSMGFEARIALDWTDHVWTEVWSDLESRWIHCDPCENVCDQPLIYEHGWNKKLTYVIACSCEEIQDVTWRYSKDHAATLARRLECREKWLINFLVQTTSQLPTPNPGRRRQRRLAELVSMLLPAKPPSETLGGRTSGSLAWRLARGECTAETAVLPDISSKNALRVTDEEKQKGEFRLRYFAATDKYVRGEMEEVSGWRSLASSSVNCFRKFEPDWKQCYVCRQEAYSGSASLEWRVDWSGARCVSINVSAQHKTFENGRVTWLVKLGDQALPAELTATGLNVHLTDTDLSTFASSTTLTISAQLDGGRGDCAWQHAQLFRCGADDTNIAQMEISVKLMSL